MLHLVKQRFNYRLIIGFFPLSRLSILSCLCLSCQETAKRWGLTVAAALILDVRSWSHWKYRWHATAYRCLVLHRLWHSSSMERHMEWSWLQISSSQSYATERYGHFCQNTWHHGLGRLQEAERSDLVQNLCRLLLMLRFKGISNIKLLE